MVRLRGRFTYRALSGSHHRLWQFWRGYANRSGWSRSSNLERGPIIIAIDESGSMTTDYGGMTGEVWSKAVMLALLSIARLQKRDLGVIHFSGPNDLRLDLFPKGEAKPAQVIACASFFFNGGTVFEPWMAKALELVDDPQFE